MSVLREALESKYIDYRIHVPSQCNYADELTKPNSESSLEQAMQSNEIEIAYVEEV